MTLTCIQLSPEKLLITATDENGKEIDVRVCTVNINKKIVVNPILKQ